MRVLEGSSPLKNVDSKLNIGSNLQSTFNSPPPLNDKTVMGRGFWLNVDYTKFALFFYNLRANFLKNLHFLQKSTIYIKKIYNY